MYQPGSPNFHQWLTADQLGAQYGPNAKDIAAVTGWLTSHGFQVNEVAKSGMVVDFSGTAAQIKSAFRTEMHSLTLRVCRMSPICRVRRFLQRWPKWCSE